MGRLQATVQAGDPAYQADRDRISTASIGLSRLWGGGPSRVTHGGPRGAFGPRVQAMTALCAGAYHLSKRTTQGVREDLFGVSIGLSTLAHLEEATTQAVAEPVAEARRDVQQHPAAYPDETGVARASSARGCGPRSRPGARRLWCDCRAAVKWHEDPWESIVGGWSPLAGGRITGIRPGVANAAGRMCCRDIEAMIARGGPSPAIGEAWRAHASDVPLVASGAPWHPEPCQYCLL